MFTREQIVSERMRLREAEQILDEQDFTKRILPMVRQSIGKAFVYRKNSASLPERPQDYWDVFRRVMTYLPYKSKDGVYLLFEEIQIDASGRATIHTDWDYIHNKKEIFTCGWAACKVAEYNSMRKKVMAAIDNPVKMLGSLSKEK